MILLKKISIKDFLSHKETELEFSPHESVLIDGASGAGKSSVFDAIIWALYGEGRTDNRSLVRRGAKKATVRLELTQTRDNMAPPYNKQTITIERTATPTGKHTLAAWTQDDSGQLVASPLTGVRELQAWIDKDLMGASYLLFINSAAYVQGSSESFVSQNATKRKELLLEIIRAEDYRKHYENARTALSALDNDKNRIEGQVVELEAQLGALRARMGDRLELAVTLSSETAKLKDLVPKLESLEVQKASYRAISQHIDVLARIHIDAVLDAKKFEQALKVKVERVAHKENLLQNTHAEERPEIEADLKNLTVRLVEFRNSASTLAEQEAKRNEFMRRKPVVNNRDAEAARLNQQLDLFQKKDPCPSGGQCPYHSKVLESIRETEAQIAALLALTIKEDVALAEWNTESAKLPPPADIGEIMKDITVVEMAIKTLETRLLVLDGLQRELDEVIAIEAELPALTLEMASRFSAVNRAKKLKEDAEAAINVVETTRIENDLINVRREEKEVTEKITRAQAALENLDRDEKEYAANERRVDALKGDELKGIHEKARKIGLVKDAFGSKGIETMVIDLLLPKLEDRINKVLSQLSEFRVRLDTQRKSADGESTVEGLWITILNETNEELPFEAYSGGEKLKISVSISEALATLQKVGFRLFDETFLGLDENSTESFAQVLGSLQHNFDQVYCISHLLQIKEMFDKKVEVKKHNGHSFV